MSVARLKASSSALRALLTSGRVWSREETHPSTDSFVVPLGLSEIDSEIQGGLEWGALHEWSLEHEISSREKRNWSAPLFLFGQILHNSICRLQEMPLTQIGREIFWVGRKVWPTPVVLETALPRSFSEREQTKWKDRCFFIDPPDQKHRLWACIEILRSKSAAVVICDGSGFNTLARRRIQLAAAEGDTLCLLASPPWESLPASSARTRWRLHSLVSPTRFPRWSLELSRARGLVAPKRWAIEWIQSTGIQNSDETNRLHLVSPLIGGEFLQTEGSGKNFVETDPSLSRAGKSTARRA